MAINSSHAVFVHRDAVKRVVERHHALNPRVFGSVLHGTATEQSDLDLLVDVTSETSLFDVGAIRSELTELLGIEVDVLTPGSLPERWRDRVLNEASAL